VNAAIAARRPARSVAIVMLDLNRFKHVNDVLGYRIGDLLLVQVAERLEPAARARRRPGARLGGDEFGVLLRSGEPELARSVAQRHRAALPRAARARGAQRRHGRGIGIACWPQHADGGDALLNRAEVAMYAAKSRGSGPLLYDPSVDVASAQMLTLITELRQAVEHDELRLYLQPKLALETARSRAPRRWCAGSIRSAAWCRRRVHSVRRAERLHPRLTLWVFEEAARQWRHLSDEGIELCSRSTSRPRSARPGPAAEVRGVLARRRVRGEAFCLEITESAIMDDPQRALVTLDRLSAIGFKLSIDDFGTGYSSLAYLKRLPVDELKIDQSFVRNMQADADDAVIVRSTIDLAHNLGIAVVAEGVENVQVWNMLRELTATWRRASTWAGRCRSTSSCSGRPPPRRCA
jgi:diguanylate cyclase (GGDEF)-like protein